MVQKIPPPPQFTGPEWQSFNRWLLEVTSILSNTGQINPEQVSGLLAAYAQIATSVTDITALQAGQAGQADNIASLQVSVNSLATSIATINGQITALSARAQVFNGTVVPAAGLGNDGDWYAKTSATTHVYVKVSGAWVTIV